jgi:hypothetical protein
MPETFKVQDALKNLKEVHEKVLNNEQIEAHETAEYQSAVSKVRDLLNDPDKEVRDLTSKLLKEQLPNWSPDQANTFLKYLLHPELFNTSRTPVFLDKSSLVRTVNIVPDSKLKSDTFSPIQKGEIADQHFEEGTGEFNAELAANQKEISKIRETFPGLSAEQALRVSQSLKEENINLEKDIPKLNQLMDKLNSGKNIEFSSAETELLQKYIEVGAVVQDIMNENFVKTAYESFVKAGYSESTLQKIGKLNIPELQKFYGQFMKVEMYKDQITQIKAGGLWFTTFDVYVERIGMAGDILKKGEFLNESSEKEVEKYMNEIKKSTVDDKFYKPLLVTSAGAEFLLRMVPGFNTSLAYFKDNNVTKEDIISDIYSTVSFAKGLKVANKGIDVTKDISQIYKINRALSGIRFGSNTILAGKSGGNTYEALKSNDVTGAVLNGVFTLMLLGSTSSSAKDVLPKLDALVKSSVKLSTVDASLGALKLQPSKINALYQYYGKGKVPSKPLFGSETTQYYVDKVASKVTKKVVEYETNRHEEDEKKIR